MAHMDRTDSNHTTTTTTTNAGGGAGMGIIVGALVVVVAILAYFVFVGEQGVSDDFTISVEGAGAAIENAADAVSGEGN
ncbi:hypothetical protein [uncultured Tateyamaria sp.]|uniref:hypothetical protein n=1 Tax=Tateyamaria sp. 1078 TaxID=3417464 RepID=UPI002611BCEE|nr:hypothetical protein [uncultured Tateyamaria sp.]